MKDKASPNLENILRQKAEEILKTNSTKTDKHYTDIEILKLVHELDVHQIELEMQNEELLIAKKNAQADAEKYTNLYDFAPSGYLTLSKEGDILELNFRGAFLLGKERSLLQNKRFALFVSDETRPKFNLFLEEVFDSKTTQTCEIMLSTNSEIPTFINLTGIADEDNNQCLITMLDISQRIKAEKATKVSEDKYRTLFETNRDSITIFRLDNDNKPGNFIEVNQATTALFGFTKKELLAMSVRDIEPISDKKRKARIDALLLHGKVDFETVIKNRKGNLRNVEIETIVINYLNAPAVMNITRDITERKQTEENARKAQDNLVTILGAIPDLIFEVDLEGSIYFYQGYHNESLSVPASEFMGKNLQEVFPVDAANVCIEAMQEALHKGWSTGKQYSLNNLPQGKCCFEISVSPIPDTESKDPHFIILSRDVTERKQAEKSLQENKENLQSIFDSVTEAIYIVDETGTFIEVNKGAEDMYLYSRQELIGKTPEFVSAKGLNDLDEVNRISQSVFETGIPITFEFWAERKNGAIFPKEVVINKGTYFSKEVLIVTARDITERKKAEEKLRVEKERIRTILELVGNPIFLKDHEHRITFANSAFCTLFGLDEKNIIGKTLTENVPQNEQEHFLKIDRKVLDTGITDIREETLTVKGKVHTLITSKTLFIDAAGNKSLVGSIYDITDRKKAEELVLQSKTRFSSIINTSPVAMALNDEQLNITYLNPAFVALFGYTLEDIPTIKEWFPKAYPDPAYREKIAEIWLNALKKIKQTGEDFIPIEVTIRCKNGSDKTIMVSGNPLLHSFGNEYLNNFYDITERKQAELALVNEKRRLAVILIGTGAGTWEWNIQTGVTILNEQWANIIGYTLEEIAPVSIDTWRKYTHPDDLKHSDEILEKHLQGNLDYYECELRMKHKNGNWVWILDRGKINEWDLDGKPLYMSGTHLDITVRKLAEQKLIASEKLLNETQFIGKIGSYSLDFNIGKWSSSASLDNIFGIDSNFEKTIEGWIRIIHPEWQMVMWEYLNNEVIAKRTFFNKEYKIIKIDTQEERWVHGNGEIIYDNEGKIQQLIGSIQDITTRKLKDEELKAASEKLVNLVNSTEGIVWEADALTFNYTYVSEQAERLLGYSVKDWEEPNFWENHLHPEDKDEVIEYCTSHTKLMKAHDFIYRFKAKEGNYVWLRDIVNVIIEDGKPRWLRGVMFDITRLKENEIALRESEGKYRSLVENSPDGVVIYVEEKIAFINNEGVRMLGAKDKKELIGKPVLQFVHPDSLEDLSKRMKEVVKDNYISTSVEAKFIRVDGTPFVVEVKGIPTLYEHKNAVQIIVHDITLRKQNSLELSKINRVYALISQINNLILRTHNRQELFQEICNIAVNFGKFHMSWIGLVNDNHKIITAAFAGHEEGYFTKSNITSIADEPEGRGPTGIALREARTVICNDIATDPIMKPWRKDALERGYSSVISIPIIVRNKIIGAFNLYSQETNFFSSEEEISLLEKIILNIAFTLESILVEEDRKQTEEKIRQLSQAVEQSPVAIVITNKTGMIEYVNSKFIETTGYSLDEVLRKTPRILKSGYTSPREYKDLWQTIAAGNEWHGEFHNKRKDGTLFWESATISPILNAEGKITHYIAIKEDITHRKKVEKELIKSKERAEESDRLKLVFLANMSHEIRTPMNGILGFTELLKEPKLSGEEQQEYISIIEKSGKRMLNIINDIISISKVESGQIEIIQNETNVNEQIEYLHTFFQPEAKQKGIQLTILKKLSAKDNLIKTDREKVYAVLTNLVKNALKFTNEGTIEFGCEKKGRYLEFFVKDTGLGISKSQKKIIFERFRQANETISRTHEGSGLGLAISKAYVEMLDGKIWVESQVGKGSTFYFTIPFHPQSIAEDNTVIEKVPTILKEENKVKDLKVLIVEDDAISKLLITIAIKPYSKEILKVSTGIEAIEACRNNPDIDLVMMDINMPEMDGYEATKNIREFNKDLIIIAQTANGMQSDRDDAIAAGCTDYISKPINITDLGALIQKYFN